MNISVGIFSLFFSKYLEISKEKLVKIFTNLVLRLSKSFLKFFIYSISFWDFYRLDIILLCFFWIVERDFWIYAIFLTFSILGLNGINYLGQLLKALKILKIYLWHFLGCLKNRAFLKWFLNHLLFLNLLILINYFPFLNYLLKCGPLWPHSFLPPFKC